MDPYEPYEQYEPYDEPAPRRRGRKRSRRRRRRLITMFVILALLGSGAVAGGLYYSSIKIPDTLVVPEATTVYYSDGKTVLARLGGANRTIVDIKTLPSHVQDAVIATEDPDFWTASGAKISRSVTRLAFHLDGDSIATKARVAIMTRRLEDKLSKDDILSMYLNTIPFGRAAYGIEAAAKVYFAKSAKDLKLEEAMLLAGVVERPDGTYDPALNPTAAQDRVRYVRQRMLSAGLLDRVRADAVAMPATVEYDPKVATNGLEKPAGLVVAHALSELRQTEAFKSMSWDEIRNGGFSIVTTVDSKAQALVDKTADETLAGSVMAGQPANLQAAAVVVEPGTGRVLAYFGGHSGTGADFAGWYYDANGDPTGYGAHPAGNTFQVYALAAALKEGYSVRSLWDAKSPKDFPEADRTGTRAVRNDGKCPTGRTVCSLTDSAVASLNTPFYALGSALGPARVVDMARAAGIDFMWTYPDANSRLRVDLRAQDGAAVVPKHFNADVGLGLYPVTVLDQANAMATFAAGGRRGQAHFVKQVSKGGREVYTEPVSTGTEPRALDQPQLSDLTWTLSRTSAGKLKGIDSATKTGTWQVGTNSANKAHAWMIGYTGKLAMAVWVGNKAEEKPIKDLNDKTVTGSTLPASIYRAFMTRAHPALGLAPVAFAKPSFGGDLNPPGSVPP